MSRNKQAISPTEIETREDALAEDEELADYSTLDRGLKAIAATLRFTVIIGALVVSTFAVLGVLYVQHEERTDERTTAERYDLVEGICGTVEDVTHTQVQALLAAASLDGVPPSDAVIAAYVDPIEEAIDRCYDQIPAEQR